MIEFTCVCKQYKFSLPPEMAGSLIQCPTCRRLCDVPTLDELAHLDADGGYKFDGESTSQQLDAKVATRAFSRERIDEFGEEIDMRTTFEQVQRAGAVHVPGTLDGVRPIPPKYDPISGELIRPLAIKDEIPQRVLPVEPESDEPLDAVPIPPPKLSYSVVPPASISLGGSFVALLRPVNVIVMGFILLIHFFAHLTTAVTLSGFYFVFVAPLVLVMALIGHYGNVIEETGPGGRDELPTPLRNASFTEDMWRPFTQVSFALFLAFLPLWISEDIAMPLGARSVVQFICLVAGILAAPALLLTAVTSGTFLNLRPDRVAGVMAICGARYGILALTFTAGAAAYWFAVGILVDAQAVLLTRQSFSVGFTELGTGYAALGGAIYLMHAFCWQLGLVYRTYHERFPWILQRHVPVRMAQRTRSHPGHLPPARRI
jgi:hypothetical protein